MASKNHQRTGTQIYQANDKEATSFVRYNNTVLFPGYQVAKPYHESLGESDGLESKEGVSISENQFEFMSR
ncbi:hypothetical protein H5410_019481 [Solanum commersonii]|uniref:Uncharacterized protein n=1 Tax=Solanum commersonii TaxID=4109 RepID=A0A9J5Z8F3_SOLCO|nr:hypothetical protein H5410_019481 [Solanum commersonii]